MDYANVLRTVQHYQKSILNSHSDEERLLHCVKRLKYLPITVGHLSETGVGRTVNYLRKWDGKLGNVAGALVEEWKSMVMAEEEKTKKLLENGIYHHVNNEQLNGYKDHNSETPIHATNHLSEGVSSPTEAKNIKIQELPEKTQHRNGVTQHKSNEHDKNRHSHSHRHSHSKDKHSSKNTHESQKSASKHTSSSTTSHRQCNGYTETKHNSDEENVIKSQENSKRSREHREHKDKHHSKSSKDKHREKEQPPTEHHEHKHSKKRKHEGGASSDEEDPLENHKVKKSKHKKKKEERHETEVHHKKHKNHDKATERNEESKHKPKKSDTSRKEHTPEGASDNSVERNVVNVKIDKDQVDNDGIDSSMGANFADVLGMLNMPVKKSKKSTHSKSSTSPQKSHKESRASTSQGTSSSSSKDSKSNGSSSMQPSTSRSAQSSSSSYPISNAKPKMLSSSAKLEPLDPSIALELPIIPNNYRPAPINPAAMECVYNTGSTTATTAKPQARSMTDSEALTHSISSKTMRTKIYSGVKTGQILQVPTLFDLCIRLLQKNIDALEFTGGVPFEVLRPVLERATPMQLASFEEYNPYIIEDSDLLWQQHVQRQFRAEKRQEMESWREMYFRCQDDKERKLSKLAENIKKSQKEIAAPVRKTQLAYVDSMVKPPRNVQRKQEQYGTKSRLIATPAARVPALQVVTPNAGKSGDTRLRIASSIRDTAQVSSSGIRNKKAPLMAKTLQLLRGRHKR